MSVINGTDLTVYVPTEATDADDASTVWTAVALAKTGSLSISADLPDASTKDSSGWAESIAGQRSWTMSTDGLVDFSLTDASGANIDGLWDYFTNRSKIKVALGQDNYYFYGDSFIESLELSSEMESPVTFSASFKGTGALNLDSDSIVTDASGYPNA